MLLLHNTDNSLKNLFKVIPLHINNIYILCVCVCVLYFIWQLFKIAAKIFI